jgi:hypothetical protein
MRSGALRGAGIQSRSLLQPARSEFGKIAARTKHGVGGTTVASITLTTTPHRILNPVQPIPSSTRGHVTTISGAKARGIATPQECGT